MNSVELHNAFSFDCPICGKENFVRGITCELSPEDRKEMSQDHGIGGVTGDWMLAPKSVACRFCEEELSVEDTM